jgi:hypothetical protein
MKYLKVLAVAIIAMFAFEGAQAQVVVKARVGAPVQRTTYHRKTVVVTRPVYRPRYHRAVVVNRPVYRRTVVRPAYRRNAHTRVVVRRNY